MDTTIKKFTPLDLLNKYLTYKLFECNGEYENLATISFNYPSSYWMYSINNYKPILDEVYFKGFDILYTDGAPHLTFRTIKKDIITTAPINIFQKLIGYNKKLICKTEITYELSVGLIKQTLSFSETQEIFNKLEESEKIYNEKKHEKELEESYLKLNQRML